MAVSQGVVGPQGGSTASLGAGSNPILRQGNMGDLISSELHGRFYEAAYRSTMYSWGKTVTALSANSITLSATTTPIIGVWNPLTSTVNLVIAQAALTCYINTYTNPVGPGTFVWAASTGNGAISTGNTPWSRKTLTQVGSAAKGFDLATALTGLTTNTVIFDTFDGLGVPPLTWGAIGAPTVPGNLPSVNGVHNFDGSLIVPPGGVLTLLNTTSSTTWSAAARILWEEVPI